MASGKVIAEHDIALTELEVQIFDVLREAARSRGMATVIRVAGGWVRDKVLGRENHDIDIALDDSTGEAFANVVNEHLAASGHETHSVNVIQANPEQSKHLETATVNVLGMQLDFVNLRAEEYATDSRIPTARFGTAEEDALRRDFTINALFFNVNTNSVEDLTGHGFRDLKAGVLRTPLTPTATLLDDPLRVLRAVRFASRFGFALAPDLRGALELPEVRRALAAKVSRERVGAELEGMLASARPVGAMRMLHARGLLPIVLSPPRVAAHEPAEAAAMLIREAKNGSKRGKQAAASTDTSGEVGGAAPLTGVVLEDKPAARVAQWLLDQDDVVDEPHAATAQVVRDAMLVVDACDAIVAASMQPTTTSSSSSSSSSGGIAAVTSPRIERAQIQTGVPGATPVPVVVGSALREEDADRAAAIEREEEEEAASVSSEGDAASPEAQQHPDHVGRCSWLSDDERRVVLLASLTWPLRAACALGLEGKERGKLVAAPAAVLRQRLRRRAKDCTDVACVHEAAPLWAVAASEASAAGLLAPEVAAVFAGAAAVESAAPAADERFDVSGMQQALPGALSPVGLVLDEAKAAVDAAVAAARAQGSTERARVALGLAVRASKAQIKPSLLCAAAAATASTSGDHSPTSSSSSSSAAEAAAGDREMLLARLRSQALDCGVLPALDRLLALLGEQGLADAASWKPLVDGKALRKLGVSSGPAMRPLMEAQLLWRLAHPSGTREECEAVLSSWLKHE